MQLKNLSIRSQHFFGPARSKIKKNSAHFPLSVGRAHFSLWASSLPPCAFLFLYFLFLFFTKIYFRFGNLQKYTPAAPLPGGRDLAARLPGGRGLSAKKEENKLRTGPWEPAAGRPASQAARRRRPAHPPLYKGVGCPSPSFDLLKIQKKKEREGGRDKAAKPCRILKPATLGN